MTKIVKFNPKKDMCFLSKYKRDYYNRFLQIKKENKFNFLVGDIEAYLNKENQFIFKLGIFFDGIDFYICYDLKTYYESIVKYFEKREIKMRDRKIYFHNLNFDIIFFLKELSFKDNLKVINSGNMFLKLDGGDFYFLNSLSLLPMSLKNVVKQWLSINFVSWETQKSDIFSLSNEELETYCMRDNFLLFMGLDKLFNKVYSDYKIKNFLTIPSLSIKLFKKCFNNTKILENKKSPFFNNGYYFGGHTEKFIKGKYFFDDEDLDYYDVNSLYPYIMRDLEINESSFKMIKPTLKNVYKLLNKKQNFFIDLEIEIKNDLYRVIPVKFDKKNYYPKGVFRCKISHLTINFLRENNHLFIKKIHGLMTHLENKNVKPFENYVNTFYKLRKSDAQNNNLYKLLLNALYGKFGQNEEQTHMEINPNNFEKFTSVTKFNDNFLCSVDESVNYNIDYLRKDIAGLITEKARLHMAKSKLKFYKNGIKCYYQDTDSLLVNKDASKYYNLKSLINNKELGLFKRENEKSSNECILLGLKLYYFNEKLNAKKGLKNLKKYDYIRIAKALEIKEIINNKTPLKFYKNDFKLDLKIYPRLLFYNDRFTQPKTFIKKGFFGIQKVPFYITEISEKLDKLPLNYYI